MTSIKTLENNALVQSIFKIGAFLRSSSFVLEWIDLVLSKLRTTGN
jgi:hypothetical protein